MASTWQQLILDSLIEIGVYMPDESLRAEDEQFCARKLTRIIDRWTARRVFAYTTNFALYTLTPNHSPHRIGPNLLAPDFATVSGAPRPQRIESASLVLTDSTPVVDSPQLNIRDAAWWAANKVKGLTSTVPTDLYYEPDFPNGSLNFWPVPTFAYSVRIEAWTALTQVPADLTTSFSAPPAYESTVLYELALDLCASYGRGVPADLPSKLQASVKALQSDNDQSPRVASADWGTRGSKTGGGFNWMTGTLS